MNERNKPGDLRVSWFPQIPCEAFTVPVASVAEGVKIMDTLAEYDLFQLRQGIKPDYCNAGTLERYEADDGDGAPGWCDWYDEESGEDDPRLFMEATT